MPEFWRATAGAPTPAMPGRIFRRVSCLWSQPLPSPPAGTAAREPSFACKGKNFKPCCVAMSQWNQGTLNPSYKKHILSDYNSININNIVQHEEYHQASSAPSISISGWLSHPDAASLNVPPPPRAPVPERGGHGAAAVLVTGTAGRWPPHMQTPGERVPPAAHLPPNPIFRALAPGAEPPRRRRAGYR